MNKGINRIAAAVGALAIGLSCTGGATTDYPLLPFPRQETPVRLDDLFRGVEITPLETTEASLLSYPELLKTCRDTLFVFDRSNSSLLLFAPDGKFIRRIGRIGRGPGEYLRARDFLIDPEGRTVSLLNPIGEIITYGFDGGFIRRERLPEPPANYQHFERLDAKSLVTWSSEHRAQEGGVRIWTREGFALRNHFFPASAAWSSLKNGSVFNRYRDTVYYHESLDNRVYAISSDGVRTAYAWDTEPPIEPGQLTLPENEIPAAGARHLEEYTTGKIPFFFGRQLQSGRYYYAALFSGYPQPRQTTLFHDRKTGRSFRFHRTEEGLPVGLYALSDGCALGLIPYEEREAFAKALPPREAERLLRMREDDNPVLVKYLF